LRDLLGLNIKLVSGYPDSGGLFLAVERKEIDGRSLDYSALRSSRPAWMKPESGMYALLQFGRATRHPDFPDTPVAGELARDENARRMIEVADISNTLARPFAAPPAITPCVGTPSPIPSRGAACAAIDCGLSCPPSIGLPGCGCCWAIIPPVSAASICLSVPPRPAASFSASAFHWRASRIRGVSA
jgi:hypothetical protein